MIRSEDRQRNFSDRSEEQEKSTLAFINKKFLLMVLVIWLTIFTLTHFTQWQEKRQRFAARKEQIRLENTEREEVRVEQYEMRTRRQQLEQEKRQRLNEIDMQIARERRAQIQTRNAERQRYNNYGVW